MDSPFVVSLKEWTSVALQAASTFVKWDSLPFAPFPGCVTRCSRPYPYITIYAAQIRESDKKSKVWLSDLFQLQEILISFLILLHVEEEEKRLWVCSSWSIYVHEVKNSPQHLKIQVNLWTSNVWKWRLYYQRHQADYQRILTEMWRF